MKYSYNKLNENPLESRCSTHTHTDMNKPTVAFHNFAKAPKNQTVTFFIIKCNGEWSNMWTKMSKICNTSTSLRISHCVTVCWRFFYPTTMGCITNFPFQSFRWTWKARTIALHSIRSSQVHQNSVHLYMPLYLFWTI